MNTMTTITIVSLTAFVSFLLTAVLGRWLVPMLHRLKFGQTIRDIGPAWHKNKQGTPTMGGIMFALGMVVTLVVAIVVCELFLPVKIFREGTEGNIVNSLTSTRLVAGVLLALFCGMIGFIDDYIKVVKKRNLGLAEKQKLFLQLVVALAYAMSLYMAGGTGVYIPVLGEVDFGLWFIPFCMLVVVSATNAVNLTDGIDGLCGTVSFVVALFFLIAAGITGYFGMSLASAAFAGALAGFLVWNLHPARVFMGDTGSLMIGGMLCALAFGIGRPLLLLPAGIVYIIETLSVILQVTYFKLTHGKRLFKMSPLHHHFEMSGWSENKIVLVFSFIALIGCIGALLLVFYA